MLVPVIVPATGNGLMVTPKISLIVPHEFVTEQEIVALPAPTPVTKPVPSTVATVTSLLLHVPPVVAVASLN